MKQVLILSGNPGSGKTTIARKLEQEGFIRLSIDDYYRKSKRDPQIEDWFRDERYLDEAYAFFEKDIFSHIEQGSKIVIETSGVGKRWKDIFKRIKEDFSDNHVTIYLSISEREALARIKKRNIEEDEMKLNEERVKAFFEKSKDISNEYECVLDADGSVEEILRNVNSCLNQ